MLRKRYKDTIAKGHLKSNVMLLFLPLTNIPMHVHPHNCPCINLKNVKLE